LNLAPTFSPTIQPTVNPTLSPTGFPTKPPQVNGTQYGGNIPGTVTQHYLTEDRWVYNYIPPVSAHCYMTSTDDGLVLVKKVGLRNLTLHLDEIGESQNSSNKTDIFGMLIRMEFENFDCYMSGKIMCDIYLDMDIVLEAFSNFATYTIYFMVSREEFSSGSAGITEYIRSVRKVWRSGKNVVIDQIFTYAFEETTFDGKSDFTAEVHMVDDFMPDDAKLNVEVYPYPTVVHYISFERYSYLDWLADVGGFYTLAFGCFFVFSTRVTKLANRRDVFQRKQGILPVISLTHRNAEELSGLRSLVLASLGITEQEYFSKQFEKQLTKLTTSLNLLNDLQSNNVQ